MRTKADIERAAQFFEDLAERIKDPNSRLTEVDKRLFEELGMGTIDLDAQTINMDPAFAASIKQAAADYEFLENLPDTTKH